MDVSDLHSRWKLRQSEHYLRHIRCAQEPCGPVRLALAGIDPAHTRRGGTSREQTRHADATQVQALSQTVRETLYGMLSRFVYRNTLAGALYDARIEEDDLTVRPRERRRETLSQEIRRTHVDLKQQVEALRVQAARFAPIVLAGAVHQYVQPRGTSRKLIQQALDIRECAQVGHGTSRQLPRRNAARRRGQFLRVPADQKHPHAGCTQRLRNGRANTGSRPGHDCKFAPPHAATILAPARPVKY